MLAVAALAATAVSPVAAGGQLPGHFGGEAWGTHANAAAGDIAARLGRSAYQPCPCMGTDGETRSNTADTVRAGDAFRAAEVESTAMADKRSDMTAVVRTTSTVTGVRALDGLITADAIVASARTDATAGGFSTTAAGSRFVDLRIGGDPVDDVAVGQRIDLPGFGYVILRDVDRYGDGATRRGIQVEMLRIVITTENDLDIPVGTRMTAGHADAAYSRLPARSFVGGAAWASDASSSADQVENRVGRSAAVYIGCLARGELRRSNEIDRLTVAGLLDNGSGTTTVVARAATDEGFARARSRIEHVDLLDGMITADVVRAVATSTWTAGDGGVASSDGSRFVGLTVLGTPISDQPEPGTVIDLPGVGELTLYDRTLTERSDGARAVVTMLVLRFDASNSFDVPAGTVMRYGFARSYAEAP
jgi:hypothetical protein